MSKFTKRLLLIVGIAVLAVFISQFDPQQMRSLVQSLSFHRLILLLTLSVTITFFNLLLKAYRWKILCHKIAAVNISIPFSLYSIITGVAASSIIPGRIEIAKPLLLKTKYDISLSKSFSALIVERALDLLSLLIIPAIAILISPVDFIRTGIVLVALASLFGILLLLLYFQTSLQIIVTKIIHRLPLLKKEKIGNFTTDVITSFSILRSDGLLMSFLSLFANGLEVLRFYIIFQIFGVTLSFAIIAAVFTGSLLLGILSTIPGGIGITEFSAVALLGKFSPETAAIKAAVLMDRIISYYLLILLGGIMLMFQGDRESPMDSGGHK
ncbi:flippase-like domain-containing protein [Candidatus Woesearchaeota archaeon]|nr:flippase-like domain-containing protein [Candidatus Woesearchaeota archaeon]